jgi:NADH-quinone oxidoreductase subunit C
MDFSQTQTFVDLIKSQLKIQVELNETVSEKQPQIVIAKENLLEVCKLLYQNPKCYFDFLNCVSAVDNGIEANTLDLIYHLTSIPFGFSVIIKTQTSRNLEAISAVDSVSSIWKSADWHEREIFDFFGITFNNHPDLRRILLPADWQGHPLRKDYVEQELYHNIKVKY